MRLDRLGLLAVLVCGCFAPPPQTPGSALVEAATMFAEQIRWGRTENLVSYIPPAGRRAFLDRHDKVREELEFTEFEIARAEMGKTRDDGKVRLTLTWHSKQDWVVHKTTVEQMWVRKSDRWWMVDAKRISGEPNPLFDGKADAKAGAAGAAGRTDGGAPL
jgi:uncharacterized protein YchJ